LPPAIDGTMARWLQRSFERAAIDMEGHEFAVAGGRALMEALRSAAFSFRQCARKKLTLRKEASVCEHEPFQCLGTS